VSVSIERKFRYVKHGYTFEHQLLAAATSAAPTENSANLRLVWEEPAWDDEELICTGNNNSHSRSSPVLSEISTMARAALRDDDEDDIDKNRLRSDMDANLKHIYDEANWLTSDIEQLMQRSGYTQVEIKNIFKT
jgi:hypothetical protein